MRPVTPFMMMPTEWMVFSLMDGRYAFGFSVHCGCAPSGSGGRFDAGARQRAVQFLPPVRHVAGRAVAVDHAHRRVADVGQLVEDAGGM